jgi:hypothetical protein
MAGPDPFSVAAFAVTDIRPDNREMLATNDSERFTAVRRVEGNVPAVLDNTTCSGTSS